MISEETRSIWVRHPESDKIRILVSEVNSQGDHWINIQKDEEGMVDQQWDVASVDDIDILIDLLLEYSDRKQGLRSELYRRKVDIAAEPEAKYGSKPDKK